MNIQHIYFDIFLSCGIVHLILTAVMALFARHQVKYLAIAWIMGIFAFSFLPLASYASTEGPHPGVLHPAMLTSLMATSFLQSVYPLSIPLPGYLQWGRMLRYASPAIAFLAFYAFGFAMGSKQVVIENFSDFRTNLLSSDLLIRLGMLLTSFYYIFNIFRLPHHLAHVAYPRYLIAYSSLLGLNDIFFLYIAFNYHTSLIMVYAVIFTLLNAYLCMRVLESLALELPKPVIVEVKEMPTEEEIVASEQDFNDANLKRFQRAEYWMQNHRDVWTDSGFKRDDLCRETGINRHLLLQCLRSQGYNNVHDYINSYRIDELKRLIRVRKVTTVNGAMDVGFGTVKTVRTCFEKVVGISIDRYLEHPESR